MDLDKYIDMDEELFAYNRAAQERVNAMRQRHEQGIEDPLESLSPDQIEELWKRSETAKAERDADAQKVEASRVFIAERPTFVQNPRNAQRMMDWCSARGFDMSDPDHFHQAANALERHGLIETKPLPAQPRTRYTQEDLETMPLDQLEELIRRGQ